MTLIVGNAVQETILKAYEKLPTLKNGALIIRNSFPQLVDIDNLRRIHFWGTLTSGLKCWE